jgi:chromosome segregation ATPase
VVVSLRVPCGRRAVCLMGRPLPGRDAIDAELKALEARAKELQAQLAQLEIQLQEAQTRFNHLQNQVGTGTAPPAEMKVSIGRQARKAQALW